MASYRELIGLEDSQSRSLTRAARGMDQLTSPRTICCTAVSAKRKNGFHVPVKNIGTAHFAEALIKPGRRRLTLIRLEIPQRGQIDSGGGQPGPGRIGGGDVDLQITREAVMLTRGIGGSGSMSVGSVEGNGTQTWP